MWGKLSIYLSHESYKLVMKVFLDAWKYLQKDFSIRNNCSKRCSACQTFFFKFNRRMGLMVLHVILKLFIRFSFFTSLQKFNQIDMETFLQISNNQLNISKKIDRYLTNLTVKNVSKKFSKFTTNLIFWSEYPNQQLLLYRIVKNVSKYTTNLIFWSEYPNQPTAVVYAWTPTFNIFFSRSSRSGLNQKL